MKLVVIDILFTYRERDSGQAPGPVDRRREGTQNNATGNLHSKLRVACLTLI